MKLKQTIAISIVALGGTLVGSGATVSAQTGAAFDYEPTEGPVDTVITITNGGCTSVQDAGDAIALYRASDGALVDAEVQLGNDPANPRPWTTTLTVSPTLLTAAGATEATTPGDYVVALFCDIGSSFRPPNDPDFPTSPGDANLTQPFVVTGQPSPPTPEEIADVVGGLPADDFRTPDHQVVIVTRLVDIGSLPETVNTVAIEAQVRALRSRVDGCGAAPDKNDWIVDCTSQAAVRGLVDELLASL
jgi:hypothetical protein